MAKASDSLQLVGAAAVSVSGGARGARSANLAAALVLGCLLSGCGCKCPEAESPAGKSALASPEPEPIVTPKEEEEVVAPASVEAAPASEPEPKKEAAEPRFVEGMSVNEAIAAVPPGTEFIGIDRETLGQPLSEPKLYEPCKLSPNQRFTLRVAVWNGKAVGIDVTSKSKTLSECIREQVTQVEWRDKVKAINTIDFSY